LKHWQELINTENLTEDEIVQIPSYNLTNFYSMIHYYQDNNWGVEALLSGTGLSISDFEDFSKWVNPIQNKQLIENLILKTPVFLSHRIFYNIGFKCKKENSVLSTIFKYTPFDLIMLEPNKISRKLDNSYKFNIVKKDGDEYLLKIVPKPFKKSMVYGHEVYGYLSILEALLELKKIRVKNKKSICFSANIKEIIDQYYTNHGFEVSENNIFHNNELIAQRRTVNILGSDYQGFEVVNDYTYLGETIFKKGELYNAPFDLYSWKVSKRSLFREKIRNVLLKIMHKSISVIEKQLELNNKKAQDLLQLTNVVNIEKRNRELLLAKIVHEIKSPLASIVMLIDSLDEEIPQCSNFIKEGFTILEDKSNKLINFVDNVMSYFNIDNNNFDLNIEVIDLAFLMSDVLDNFEHVKISSGTSLICKMMPDKYIVNGDYYRLLQVFLNIVSNSVKFTRDGEIIVEADFYDNYICISIKDTGCGISSDKITDIFNMFNILQQNPGHNHNGLGLGLYISKNIVLKHKGYIEVDSEVGTGTEFRIFLPVAECCE